MLTYAERQERKLAYDRFKDRLNAAFALMRKMGLVARQNCSCCNSCGWSEIATDFGAMPKAKQAKVKGAVFYNKQSTATLKETGEVWLAYGSIEHYEGSKVVAKTALDATTVGYMITTALAQAGIPFEWNGDSNMRITAKLHEIPYRLTDALKRSEFAS